MSNKDISRSLLNQAVGESETHGSGTGRNVAEFMMRHDRHLRLWTGIITVLWIIAGAGGVLLCFGFFVFIYPRLPGGGVGIWGPGLTPVAMTVAWVTMCCLVLAGVGTILVLFASRRATLTQIRNSLAAISEQLNALQQEVRRGEKDGARGN
jgi:hypothetical protein